MTAWHLLDFAKNRIDQLTPRVDGFTRTQVVALAVAAYLHGMAEAHEHRPFPGPIAREFARELRALADRLVDDAGEAQ
jgi:hypothetical protein